MRAGLAFLAGAIGWGVMVVLLIIARATGVTDLNVSMILGSLFTREITAGTWVLGFVIGIVISGLIALVYAAVFESLRRANWGLGLVGGIIGLLVAVLLQGLGAPAIPGESYGWYKGLYGGLLPVLLQPSMTYAILRNTAATPVSGSRPAC